MTIEPRIPTYNTGTEHVGFSPTRQTLLVSSAQCPQVLSESHEGCELHARRTLLHLDGSVEWNDLFSGVAASGGSEGGNILYLRSRLLNRRPEVGSTNPDLPGLCIFLVTGGWWLL